MAENRVGLSLTKGTAMLSLDSETQAFLERFDSLPTSLHEHRSKLAAHATDDTIEQVDVELVQIAGPHVRGPLRIVRPRVPKEKLPLLLYFHGGAWTKGLPHSHDRWLHRLAARAEMAVASVDDALPDNLSLIERIQAAEYIAEVLKADGAGLGVDHASVAIGGDSIGGFFAAALALAVTKRRTWSPFALLLICPLILGSQETPSRKQFASGPWLTMDVLGSMLKVLQHDHSRSEVSLPSSGAASA